MRGEEEKLHVLASFAHEASSPDSKTIPPPNPPSHNSPLRNLIKQERMLAEEETANVVDVAGVVAERQLYLPPINRTKPVSVRKCIHNKSPAFCVACGGSQICEHGKRKSRCVGCKGSQVCVHLKLKSQCVACGGSQICPHRRQKAKCKDCKGSHICPHNRQKDYCKDCKGKQICVHLKHRAYCKTCKAEREAGLAATSAEGGGGSSSGSRSYMPLTGAASNPSLSPAISSYSPATSHSTSSSSNSNSISSTVAATTYAYVPAYAIIPPQPIPQASTGLESKICIHGKNRKICLTCLCL